MDILRHDIVFNESMCVLTYRKYILAVFVACSTLLQLLDASVRRKITILERLRSASKSHVLDVKTGFAIEFSNSDAEFEFLSKMCF